MCLLISHAPPDSLFSYTKGDMLLDHFMEIVGHADDVTFLDEQLELLPQRMRDMHLELR